VKRAKVLSSLACFSPANIGIRGKSGVSAGGVLTFDALERPTTEVQQVAIPTSQMTNNPDDYNMRAVVSLHNERRITSATSSLGAAHE
jgi:hypothetical protein